MTPGIMSDATDSVGRAARRTPLLGGLTVAVMALSGSDRVICGMAGATLARLWRYGGAEGPDSK